jgi:hypothetical protein
MIPKRSEIKPVILAVLADGEAHLSPELQEIAATHFRLTAAELSQKRGKHLAFENEHAFALNLLVQDRMIDLVDPLRRIYKATRRGLDEADSTGFVIRGRR